MKLTKKCKKEFKQWLENAYNIHSTEWEELNKTCRNALIADWFDSVGIYIAILPKFSMYESFCNSDRIGYFNSRHEATNAAIEKANIIYNENKL